MRNTFKLSFFLKRSAVRKNGKTPIMGRIIVNGKKVEFSTKLEIMSSKWSVEAGEGKGNNNEVITLNENLNSIRMTIYSFYRNLSEQHEVITAKD